jgi:hypothetical protein
LATATHTFLPEDKNHFRFNPTFINLLTSIKRYLWDTTYRGSTMKAKTTKIKTEKGSSSGNTYDMYLADAWFESQLGHYCNSGCSCFSSVPLGEWQVSTSIRPKSLSSTSFPFHDSLINLPFYAVYLKRWWG